MKRLLACLAILLTAALALAAGAAEKKTADSKQRQAQRQEKSLPAPANEGGYLERGGSDIGRSYGYGSKELGRGTAEFGRQFGKGEFGEAGRSFGRGAGEFGKGIGVGTARGFKNFGLALRNLGKKIDRSVSDDQKDQQKDN